MIKSVFVNQAKNLFRCGTGAIMTGYTLASITASVWYKNI